MSDFIREVINEETRKNFGFEIEEKVLQIR